MKEIPMYGERTFDTIVYYMDGELHYYHYEDPFSLNDKSYRAKKGWDNKMVHQIS